MTDMLKTVYRLLNFICRGYRYRMKLEPVLVKHYVSNMCMLASEIK